MLGNLASKPLRQPKLFKVNRSNNQKYSVQPALVCIGLTDAPMPVEILASFRSSHAGICSEAPGVHRGVAVNLQGVQVGRVISVQPKVQHVCMEVEVRLS